MTMRMIKKKLKYKFLNNFKYEIMTAIIKPQTHLSIFKLFCYRAQCINKDKNKQQLIIVQIAKNKKKKKTSKECQL